MEPRNRRRRALSMESLMTRVLLTGKGNSRRRRSLDALASQRVGQQRIIVRVEEGIGEKGRKCVKPRRGIERAQELARLGITTERLQHQPTDHVAIETCIDRVGITLTPLGAGL